MSCEQNILNFIKNPDLQLPSYILVLISGSGNFRLYNKAEFKKSFCRECPRGFSYHVTLCDIDLNEIPTIVIDPSRKKIIQQRFADYMQTSIAVPNADDSSLLYGTLPLEKFLAQKAANIFIPSSVPNLKLTYI
ncbi:MAG TPA: hypothetical protein VG895_02930 [Patescibacteria group bacterium]|nr:hypothetical protein [Patescibacteria group bacterium]